MLYNSIFVDRIEETKYRTLTHSPVSKYGINAHIICVRTSLHSWSSSRVRLLRRLSVRYSVPTGSVSIAHNIVGGWDQRVSALLSSSNKTIRGCWEITKSMFWKFGNAHRQALCKGVYPKRPPIFKATCASASRNSTMNRQMPIRQARCSTFSANWLQACRSMTLVFFSSWVSV